MKLSEQLDSSVETLCKKMRTYPWEDFHHYTAWAPQHYYLIQNTPHLLHLCCANVPPRDQMLFREFEHHLAEEKAHDKLIEKDMQQLGYDMSKDACSPYIAAIVDLQHHYVNKFGPIVFLGYGLLLEGMAYRFGREMAERLASAYGKRSVFIDVHVDSDEAHYPDGLRRIDDQVSDSRTREAFIRNMEISTHHYLHMLDQVRREAEIRAHARVG